MKKVLICLMLVLSTLLFIGCAQEENNTAQPEKTINIGLMPDVESIPFLIAEKNGYFKNENVQVNLEIFKSAKDRDSALQSGKLDGVVTDMVAIVFANEGGINLRMTARTDGNIRMLAGKDSQITSISDLEGKNFGLSTNTVMEYTADRMLEAAGFKPDKLNKVAIPALPTRLEMLQGGKIDAAVLPEPLAGLGVKNGARELTSTEKIGSKAGVIAFTSQSLQENTAEIKAVFKAYNEAVTYLNEEKQIDYIDFVIEKLAFPAEVKDYLLLPEYTKAEAPDEQLFNDVVEWLKTKNLIEKDYEYQALLADQVLR